MSKTDLKAMKELAMDAADNCVCQRTRKAARLVTKAYDDALRPLGLRGTQFTLLAVIVGSDGRSNLTDLAGKLGMDRTTLSRNLTPLERDGLVVLFDEEHSGRTKTARLTDAGFQKFAAAEPLWRATQERVSAGVLDSDFGAMMRGLRLVSDHLS